MPLEMVNGVSRGMGVLDGGSNLQREGAVLGVNLGCPIVTNGTLLCCCMRVMHSSRLLWEDLCYVGYAVWSRLCALS